jgi:hypothetical protein
VFGYDLAPIGDVTVASAEMVKCVGKNSNADRVNMRNQNLVWCVGCCYVDVCDEDRFSVLPNKMWNKNFIVANPHSIHDEFMCHIISMISVGF